MQTSLANPMCICSWHSKFSHVGYVMWNLVWNVCWSSTLTALFEFANFLDFIIHVWGAMLLCATTSNDNWHHSFYFFLFLFGFFCCKSCMTCCFCLFNSAWCWKLKRNFFIAMLKWAPFDWSSLWYLVEVMLFKEAFDVGKVTKFTCKNFFYAKLFQELLNVTSIIVRALVFGVLWRFAVWMQHTFRYACVPF